MKKILLYLFFMGFFHHSFSTCHEIMVSEKISNALIKLSPETPFIIFDLTLSSADLNDLKKLKINSTLEYNNYGDLESLQSGISDFLLSLGNSLEIANSVSKLITKIIIHSLIGSRRETAWIVLRAFTHTDEYDIPRWHTDGTFYTSMSMQYKIVMALKGPQTLFYPKALFETLSDQMQNEFHFLSDGKDGPKENRIAQAKILDASQIISSSLNQGALFLVGDNGALHSEPPINEERLFLSILPASKEEIYEWYRNCHSIENQ